MTEIIELLLILPSKTVFQQEEAGNCQKQHEYQFCDGIGCLSALDAFLKNLHYFIHQYEDYENGQNQSNESFSCKTDIEKMEMHDLNYLLNALYKNQSLRNRSLV